MNPAHESILIIESGPRRGDTLSVGHRETSVGRASRNDVAIMDAAMSRFHCRLLMREGKGLWIRDLAPRNTTLVNDVAVNGQARLYEGDRLTLGETTIKVASVPADRLSDRRTHTAATASAILLAIVLWVAFGVLLGAVIRGGCASMPRPMVMIREYRDVGPAPEYRQVLLCEQGVSGMWVATPGPVFRFGSATPETDRRTAIVAHLLAAGFATASQPTVERPDLMVAFTDGRRTRIFGADSAALTGSQRQAIDAIWALLMADFAAHRPPAEDDAP